MIHKKNYSKWILGFVFVFFLFTRLYNLTLLPIFTDESIYIYWAKYIAVYHSHWFISLTDGKPPLLIFAISFLLSFFPSSWYLLAGRLPSVVAGCIGFIGIYQVSFLLFKSKRTAIIACLLYLFSPFILFYDRIALFDSLLSAMLIWSVYFALKTAQTRSLRDGILWGLFLGLGFLSKPTALAFFFLTPLMYLFFIQQHTFKAYYKRYMLLVGIALGISQIVNNLQRVSHVYAQAAIKNQQFQQPLSELLKNPFALTWGNLMGFYSWMVDYYSLPILCVCIASFIFLLVKQRKAGLILLGLWFLPLFVLATVGREVFPRYILFTVPYMLIALAFFLNEFFKRTLIYTYVGLGLFVVLFLPLVSNDFYLLTNPPRVMLPSGEYQQYIAYHPSGYGLDKVFSFLTNQAKKSSIVIVTQGTFGLYPYAFMLEYWDNKQVMILPRWPLSSLDGEITALAKKKQVFVILKEVSTIPPELRLHLLFKAEKPGGVYPILVTTLQK